MGWALITAGTTFTTPAGVTSIDVWCVGLGGAGAAGQPTIRGGGGGGGGELAFKQLTVAGSTTYDISIPTVTGNSTWFSLDGGATRNVEAIPGVDAFLGTGGIGGTGGTGSLLRPGGNGGDGVAGGIGGGGGGSAAGDVASGNNGANGDGAGGAGGAVLRQFHHFNVAGGGTGGVNGSAGAPGGPYGGGGGGGGETSGAGGAAGAAAIYIEWISQGVEFDNAENSGYQTVGNYNFHCIARGTENYIVVGVSMLSVIGSSVTSVKFDNDSVTLVRLGFVASAVGAVRAELWGSTLDGRSNINNQINVVLSAALASVAGAVTFNGIHQMSPYEAVNTATATNIGAADATVTVTTIADNDWVIDCLATDDGAVSGGGGQTVRHNAAGALGSGAMSTEGPKTPAGAVVMSWTGVDALMTWSIIALGLRPVAAGAASIVIIPPTAALVLTPFAPTAAVNLTVTPTTAALVTTAFAPTVNSGPMVTPPTAALVLAAFAPVIALDVIPPTLALVLTPFEPTAPVGTLVIPPTLSLATSSFAPVVVLGPVAIPPTAALVLTSYAPTVAVNNVVITPPTLALALATFIPTVTVQTIRMRRQLTPFGTRTSTRQVM